MMALALRINDFLSGLFLGVGLKLVDFKLEFGRLWTSDDEMRIVLADEISPDNCRLWDVKTNEKMDKDRFRRDLGNVEEAYQEVARRLGILPEGGPQDLQGPEDDAVTRRADAMKARVHVTLKPGVLDPQGKAIAHALGNLGFAGVERRAPGQVDRDRARRDATAAKARSRGRADVREAARQHRDRELRDRAGRTDGARMKAAVIVFPGSNREHDVADALERATGQAACAWSGTATPSCPTST